MCRVVVIKVSGWTKKKLFTVGFKGRKRRALLWRKSVYEEWFECAKIAQAQGIKIPDQFGDLSQFDFESWWKHPDYGFELFCEPFMELIHVLDSPPESITDGHLLLDINLNADEDKLIDVVTRLIKKRQGKRVEYVSKALFQPSKVMRNLKRDSLKQRRKAWQHMAGGMKHKDIVVKLGLIPKSIVVDSDLYETFMLSALRKLSRYKRAFNKSLRNIPQGTFP